MTDRKNSTSNTKGQNKKKGLQTPWLCLSCDNAIEDGQNDIVIQCFLCKEFCHKNCCGLSNAQFNACRGSAQIQWTCEACGDKEVMVKSQIEAKLDGIFQMLKLLTNRLESVEKDNIVAKIEETVEIKVREYMQDSEEKEKRKLNIIVANIPESDGGTPEERQNHDRDRVRDLVSKIPDVKTEEVDSPVRLGKFKIGQNVHPRLLRMVVKTVETKKKILQGMHALNKNKTLQQRIYINNDATPKERETVRKLKEEIRQRSQGGETNLMIDYRNLKIVVRADKPVSSDTAASSQDVPASGTPTH